MKKVDWQVVKADYMAENLRVDKEKPFLLKDLSVRWKIAYKTIRNKASLDKWNEELQGKIAEQQCSIIQKVQGSHVETEAEVRQRQATVARFMLDKALRKLATVDPDDLTKREAIELAKLGLGEERKALGLADKYEVSRTPVLDDSPTVADHIARHQQGGVLVERLLTYLGQADSVQGDCN